MTKKDKACLSCKKIYQGTKCPDCGESTSSETYKGRVYIFNTEDSQVARKMKINKKGEFAIKIK